MARVNHVKKARKNQPGGIKKGESYYWWKFRFGGKHVSKTYPRPSQLTQSEYLSAAYSLQEEIEDMSLGDLEDVASELRSVADELRSLSSDQEEKISNMPCSLQDGATAELLRSRSEACEEVAGELESAANDIDDLIATDNADGPIEDRAQDIIAGISWNLE